MLQYTQLSSIVSIVPSFRSVPSMKDQLATLFLSVCMSVCLSVLVCLCPCAHFSFTVSLLVCPPLSTSINDGSLLL